MVYHALRRGTVSDAAIFIAHDNRTQDYAKWENMNMSVKKSSAAISPVMRQVSGYIATALRRPLPEPVDEKTKHHVLDTIAAMVSGTDLPGRMGDFVYQDARRSQGSLVVARVF